MDLQLPEVMYRRENTATGSSQFSTKHKRRSQRTDEVESIYGFRRCIELYVQDEDFIKMKDAGSRLLKRDKEVWKKRPLPEDLIQYCIVDTMAMFKLYDKVKDINGGERARL